MNEITPYHLNAIGLTLTTLALLSIIIPSRIVKLIILIPTCSFFLFRLYLIFIEKPLSMIVFDTAVAILIIIAIHYWLKKHLNTPEE